MYKNKILLFLILILTFVFALNASAQTDIVVWNFDSLTTGNTSATPAPSLGAGTAIVITQSGT